MPSSTSCSLPEECNSTTLPSSETCIPQPVTKQHLEHKNPESELFQGIGGFFQRFFRLDNDENCCKQDDAATPKVLDLECSFEISMRTEHTSFTSDDEADEDDGADIEELTNEDQCLSNTTPAIDQDNVRETNAPTTLTTQSAGFLYNRTILQILHNELSDLTNETKYLLSSIENKRLEILSLRNNLEHDEDSKVSDSEKTCQNPIRILFRPCRVMNANTQRRMVLEYQVGMATIKKVEMERCLVGVVGRVEDVKVEISLLLHNDDVSHTSNQ